MNIGDDDAKEEIQLHRILDAATLTLLFAFLSTGPEDKSRPWTSTEGEWARIYTKLTSTMWFSAWLRDLFLFYMTWWHPRDKIPSVQDIWCVVVFDIQLTLSSIRHRAMALSCLSPFGTSHRTITLSLIWSDHSHPSYLWSNQIFRTWTKAIWCLAR